MDKNMKILLVDDEIMIREIVKITLQHLGFTNTFEAEQGESALAMLQSGGFDFLITDFSMPIMGGLGLLREVRSDEKLQSLPVLLMVASKSEGIEAMQAGASGYVLKPFAFEVFREAMRKIFECRS